MSNNGSKILVFGYFNVHKKDWLGSSTINSTKKDCQIFAVSRDVTNTIQVHTFLVYRASIIKR